MLHSKNRLRICLLTMIHYNIILGIGSGQDNVKSTGLDFSSGTKLQTICHNRLPDGAWTDTNGLWGMKWLVERC